MFVTRGKRVNVRESRTSGVDDLGVSDTRSNRVVLGLFRFHIVRLTINKELKGLPTL